MIIIFKQLNIMHARRPRDDLLMWEKSEETTKEGKKITNEVNRWMLSFGSFADLPQPLPPPLPLLLLLIHRYHFEQWMLHQPMDMVIGIIADTIPRCCCCRCFSNFSSFIRQLFGPSCCIGPLCRFRRCAAPARSLPNFNLIFLFNVKAHDRLHNIWLLCWCCFHDESLMHAVNFIVSNHFPWSNFYLVFSSHSFFHHDDDDDHRRRRQRCCCCCRHLPFCIRSSFSISLSYKLNYKRITDNETRTTSTNQ